MARRTKRLWTDEEKRSICFQTAAAGVSVAQVARRYAMNANMIFKWLRDPRYAPDPEVAVEDLAANTSCFLPVEIVDQPLSEERALEGRAVADDGGAGGDTMCVVGRSVLPLQSYG